MGQSSHDPINAALPLTDHRPSSPIASWNDHLVVFSHKVCWPCAESPSGFATDGGFPFQMKALSEIFTRTTILVPCLAGGGIAGEVPLTGRGLTIQPLTVPRGAGLKRKLSLCFWFFQNQLALARHFHRADVVHTPIPGDIGTIGAAMAFLFRKPLFVRYCQNWLMPKSIADRAWIRYAERFAGGRNVVLATGGADAPPSARNPDIEWIFATSLTDAELRAYADVGRHRQPVSGRARLIIVCRQERGKGVETLLESIPAIQKVFDRVSLDVVGEGRMLDAFREKAVSLGVAAQVTFHGRVDHDTVMRLLGEADLFCFPTRSEGFPKSVLEAMACGLPVITRPVSVLPHLIKGAGVIVDSASPDAIARAVAHCLSDPARYIDMSRRAVAAAGNYSLERWRDRIKAILQRHWGSGI